MKNKWRILKIMITAIVFGLLLNFSLTKFSNSPIRKIAVEMISTEEPVYFINEKEIKELINETNQSDKIGDLDIPHLERKINGLDAVDSANVFINLNGILTVSLKQKVPKFRLKRGKREVYVDANGEEFSLSDRYSHPSLIVTGAIFPHEYSKIIEWVDTIEADPFLKSYFIGLSKKKKNYYLLTNDGNFKVELGDLNQKDFKLKGFKTFIKKHLVFQPQNKYNKVSLKYDNQIVATLNKEYLNK